VKLYDGTDVGCRWCGGPVGVDDAQSVQCSGVEQNVVQSRVQTPSAQTLQEVVQHVRTLHHITRDDRLYVKVKQNQAQASTSTR